MKKWLILVLIFCLCGCQKNFQSEIVSKLKAVNQTEVKEENYQYRLKVYRINDIGYRYDVIIDQPSCVLENFKAYVYCSSEDGKAMPNIGIDENVNYILSSEKLDRNNATVCKGICLSGVSLTKNVQVKIWLSYTIDGKEYEDYVIMEDVYSD